MTTPATTRVSSTSVSSSVSSSTATVEEQLLALLALPASNTNDDDENKNGFSTAAYLNLALQATNTKPTTASSTKHSSNHAADDDWQQQRMAELALQLQLQTQFCHEEIGRIGAELQAILPRCHADVGRIGVGLQALQHDASALLQAATTSGSSHRGHGDATLSSSSSGEPMESTSSSSSSSLETLSTLHALQANLKRTHEILTAAATWDTTLAEIPPLLAPAAKDPATTTTTTTTPAAPLASNLPLAVQKLALLEQGEHALRGMPHVQDRTVALTKVRVQISNLLTPQLHHALQSSSSSRLGPLQQCVSLYAQLHLLDTLVQQYVASRPKAVHKAWFDYTAPPTNDHDNNNNVALPPHQAPHEEHAAGRVFTEWLPTWFESVLQLLQEERRQATAVFGTSHAHVVPTVLALVLQETFRPLVPSWTSRLATATQNGTHLVRLAQSYQSTLQFLAMAHDTMAACWLDWSETTSSSSSAAPPMTARRPTTSSSTTQIPTGVDMYQRMTSILVQITAPFATYRTKLAHLERAHAQTTHTQQFVPLVQNCSTLVGGTGMEEPNANNTNDDDDDLMAVTTGLRVVVQEHVVQPCGQTVLERFELLQGGYQALDILTVMDQAVEQRLNSVVAQLHRMSHHLSTTTTTSNASLPSWAREASQSLDDAHVVAALHVLHVAATAQTVVTQLQDHVRQRFQTMAQTNTTVVARETEVAAERERQEQAAAAADQESAPYSSSSNMASSSSPFVLPDSLSPVELNAYLCLHLFAPPTKQGGTNNNNNKTATTMQAAEAAVSVMQRLSGTNADTAPSSTAAPVVLLEQTQAAVQQLATACHQFVFAVCFAVPQRQLQTMASLSTWKKKTSSPDDENAVQDSYGTLPQSYITQVGEHILALVQALEPFALDTQALEIANQVMSNIRQVAEQPWRDFVTATGLSPQESSSSTTTTLVQQLMSGKEIKEFAIAAGSDVHQEDDEEKDEDEEEGHEGDQKVTAFCNAWLDVVGLAVTGRLVERILNIPQLTVKGCEHLKADLDYLQNVLVALGVTGHPHPLLDHVSQVIAMDLPSLQERIRQLHQEQKSNTTGNRLTVQSALISMEERLAAMRGVGSF